MINNLDIQGLARHAPASTLYCHADSSGGKIYIVPKLDVQTYPEPITVPYPRMQVSGRDGNVISLSRRPLDQGARRLVLQACRHDVMIAHTLDPIPDMLRLAWRLGAWDIKTTYHPDYTSIICRIMQRDISPLVHRQWGHKDSSLLEDGSRAWVDMPDVHAWAEEIEHCGTDVYLLRLGTPINARAPEPLPDSLPPWITPAGDGAVRIATPYYHPPGIATLKRMRAQWRADARYWFCAHPRRDLLMRIINLYA